MPRKPKPVDDEREDVTAEWKSTPQWTVGDFVSAEELNKTKDVTYSEPMGQHTVGFETLSEVVLALNTLSASGIVLDVDRDGAIVWRTGHLEHVARLYAADPVQTERDYHDDVTVAMAYCREQWDALVAEAKG